jgi:hypothetical protein
MKNDTKEAEKLEELLKKADAHPAIKMIRQEEADKILEERLLAAAKLRELGKEAEEVIPKLQADLAEVEDELKRYDEERKVILDRLSTARVKLAEAKGDLERETRQAETVLLGNYDSGIDEALQFFRDKLDWLRKPGRVNRIGRHAERNIFTMRKTVKEETNLYAIHETLRYCQAAIKELEKMKLTPALDIKRIQAIKDAIPSIDVYQEVTGEKPMERQAPTFIPPSDYEDEQIERLLKKKV